MEDAGIVLDEQIVKRNDAIEQRWITSRTQRGRRSQEPAVSCNAVAQFIRYVELLKISTNLAMFFVTLSVPLKVQSSIIQRASRVNWSHVKITALLSSPSHRQLSLLQQQQPR
jgi:hypothetical protein